MMVCMIVGMRDAIDTMSGGMVGGMRYGMNGGMCYGMNACMV